MPVPKVADVLGPTDRSAEGTSGAAQDEELDGNEAALQTNGATRTEEPTIDPGHEAVAHEEVADAESGPREAGAAVPSPEEADPDGRAASPSAGSADGDLQDADRAGVPRSKDDVDE